jgi:hypothetical protein
MEPVFFHKQAFTQNPLRFKGVDAKDQEWSNFGLSNLNQRGDRFKYMKEQSKSEKQKQIRNRTIRTDSLLRETSSHYIRQIGDADRKARILLVVTSVMITIGITVLTKNVLVVAQGWISAVFLIIGNIITLFFAILSIKPRLKGEAANQTENNILHYKTCTENSLESYTQKMFETLDDDQKKRDAIIKELYYYGNLLDQKYKCIEYAHRAFFWALVTTLVSYLVIYLFYKF